MFNLCETAFAELVKKGFQGHFMQSCKGWMHQSLCYLNIFCFICVFPLSVSLNVPFCKCFVYAFIKHLCTKCEIKRVSKYAYTFLCVHMCANSTGRHGMLFGEADNSPKCCPWFHSLMNSTAREAPGFGTLHGQ